MKWKITLLSCILAGALSGCAGVPFTAMSGPLFSKQEIGRDFLPAKNLAELVTRYGQPDVAGKVGDNTVLGWRSVEAFSVDLTALGFFPIFSRAELVSASALVDAKGDVIAQGCVKAGEGLSILGVYFVPIAMYDDKP